jgi:cysteine desulfurase
LAIFGIARAYKEKGRHIIVSSIEHKAILDACKKLEKEGFEITYLEVDKNGLVSLDLLNSSIRPDTIPVSIMYANNEIGTIQPIKEISRIIRNNKLSNPIFHTDACQAVGALPIGVEDLGVDALTMSSSKIYGPKGGGCLYINKKYRIDPIMVGGGQERGSRSGTENVAAIVGFSEAITISENKRISESKRLIILRDHFLQRIEKEIEGVFINGDKKQRLPNNINLSIKGVEGESLILLLDKYGVYCSTGSACSSLDLDPSHVLIKIGLPLELAHCSVRFTLGRHTKKMDVDYAMEMLLRSVAKIRSISSMR